MLTKVTLGLEIQAKIAETQDLKEIAKWAFNLIRDRRVRGFSKEINSILLTLAVMESDARFKLSIEELGQFAANLVAQRESNIKLVNFEEK